MRSAFCVVNVNLERLITLSNIYCGRADVFTTLIMKNVTRCSLVEMHWPFLMNLMPLSSAVQSVMLSSCSAGR
jgi:hypothetical protein